MKSMILAAIVGFLLGCIIDAQRKSLFKELEKLNSKIDKIIIFLDLNLNSKDEVEE